MKKLFLLAALTVAAAGAAAQDMEEQQPSEKYSVSTNSFWQNWFVQAGATWSAFYTQEPVLVAPFRKFPGGSAYTGMGVAVALGKWFTPGLGLRTKVQAWQQGTEQQGAGGDKFWTANEQVLFNLSNLLGGYSEQRFWNFIPYIGAGVNRNMSHNHYATQLSAGLLNTFRLSRHVAANVEVGWNSFEYDNTGLALKRRAHQFSAEVGLTFNIGASRWNPSPDVEAIRALSQTEIDALNAQIADMQAENERLQGLLDSQPQPVATAAVAPATPSEPVLVAAPVSVFFRRGQSVIASAKDLADVAALAAVARRHSSTRLLVTGYADSQTGSADRNSQLSRQRADAVVSELVRLGIPADRIDVVAAGGVDTLSPADYNRRATVEIK